jgi:hypothetical protein
MSGQRDHKIKITGYLAKHWDEAVNAVNSKFFAGKFKFALIETSDGEWYATDDINHPDLHRMRERIMERQAFSDDEPF